MAKKIDKPYHRLTVRLDPETYADLLRRTESEGLSANAYVAEAIDRSLKIDAGEYELPDMGVTRLNQLIDHILALSTDVRNLEAITVSNFEALLNLTRGDNYLYEYDEGDDF